MDIKIKKPTLKKIPKCLKRYETLPDYYWQNVEAIQALLSYKKNKVPLPYKFKNLKQDINGNYISDLGHYVINKNDNKLIILGDISQEDIELLQKSFDKLFVFFYKDGEVKPLSRYESIRTDDIFTKQMPNTWYCGNCPAKSSCLLKKQEGVIDFYDDSESNSIIDLQGYKWAAEQATFLEETKKNQFILVNAAAGTGKTTVINEALNQENGLFSRFKSEEIILISFTNTAAKEMSERITAYSLVKERNIENVSISTWHSLAFSLVDKKWKELGYCCKPEQVYDINLFMRDYLLSINKTVSNENLQKLYENPHGDIQSVERLLFKQYCKEKNKILLDDAFDILYKAVAKGLLKPKCLIVDEFQDSSYKELRIIELLSKELDSLILVGDMRQSIYGFRGSIQNTFSQIKEAIKFSSGKEMLELSFSESFRLPNEVASKANEMLKATALPDVKAATEKEGRVLTFDRQDLGSIINFSKGTKGILARNNAPLIHLYIAKFKAKNNVYLKLGNNLSDYPIYNILLNAIHLHLLNSPRKDYLKQQKVAFKNFQSVNGFKDILRKYDILSRYIYTYVKENESFEEILETMIKIGSEPIKIINPLIDTYLLTAHSSKGMEFDNVIIINSGDYKVKELENSNLLNLDSLKVNALNPEKEEFFSFKGVTYADEEAKKVAFVALTRSKDKLYIEK